MLKAIAVIAILLAVGIAGVLVFALTKPASPSTAPSPSPTRPQKPPTSVCISIA
jgi:hypothetical protein